MVRDARPQVLHTISLNCNTIVRNQMAVAKLLKRLEKQLARSQGPQVATALVQVLVDWGYLFRWEFVVPAYSVWGQLEHSIGFVLTHSSPSPRSLGLDLSCTITSQVFISQPLLPPNILPASQ